jgi:hypothetical protein
MKLRRMLLITLLVLGPLAALGPGPAAATPAAGGRETLPYSPPA